MPTHRIGEVKIVNQSSLNLASVSVIHKYSDNYKNQLDWTNVPAGGSTDTKNVDYHTGFLTTGTDWWLITFCDTQGKLYVSDPTNFTGLIDFITGGIKTIAELLDNVDQRAAVAAKVASLFMNDEKVSGFKEHMLRSEDEERPTEIIIKNQGDITLDSKSGKSNTVYRTAN